MTILQRISSYAPTLLLCLLLPGCASHYYEGGSTAYYPYHHHDIFREGYYYSPRYEIPRYRNKHNHKRKDKHHAHKPLPHKPPLSQTPQHPNKVNINNRPAYTSPQAGSLSSGKRINSSSPKGRPGSLSSNRGKSSLWRGRR